MTTVTIQDAYNLAIKHYHAGAHAQTEELCRQILKVQPNHPDALNLLGVIETLKGRHLIAAELIGRAIGMNPLANTYYNNLSVVRNSMGQHDAAIEAGREALRLRPDFADALYNVGNAYRDKNQLDLAMGEYRKAIKANPNYVMAYHELGSLLVQEGQLEEAVALFQQALKIKPDYANAQYSLGNAYKDMGRIEEAIDAMRAATKLKPDISLYHSMMILTMHLRVDGDARAIRNELKEWNKRHAEPLKKLILPHVNDRDPERRLKIGYLAAEFREHVVGWNLLPLLGGHDHEKFEIFCYSAVMRPDDVTRRIESMADVWRNIAGAGDEQAAQMIRNDRIDILVDLALHTLGNRLKIFAQKPAPVQMTYLGYVGSTGMDTIDYRLSDPYLDPPDADLSVYSEQTVRLPETYWCYQPGGSPPDVGPVPALAAGHITFASMNNFAKVSDPASELWMQILNAVPNSRLLIYAHRGSHRDAVQQRFIRAGIAPERMEFTGRQPWPDYMKTYNRIDIGLDPFPYNGGITTCDSLFMGVPVVTLSGHTAFGRAGTSLLTNVGLTELIAQTPEEYVRITVKLANDLPRLKKLRSGLRQRIKKSPLMDAERFAKNIEAAYRDIWRRYAAKGTDDR
ncbi:MAG TPA: tetratricopeptide repeat protein [Phycisphaerae bacterium]|nr:tetratricopeptide repeat protein [Phycisphaerae bacterium]